MSKLFTIGFWVMSCIALFASYKHNQELKKNKELTIELSQLRTIHKTFVAKTAQEKRLDAAECVLKLEEQRAEFKKSNTLKNRKNPSFNF